MKNRRSYSPRFFIDDTLNTHQTITVSGAVFHHIQVLRLKNQEKLILFNGQGGAYQGVIQKISRHQAQIQLEQFLPDTEIMPRQVIVIQSLLSSEKMDWVIEKSVELGATQIQPISTQKSQTQRTQERQNKQYLHWQRIIQAASAQCARNILPKLHPVQALDHYLTQCTVGSSIKLILSLNASLNFLQLFNTILSNDQHTDLYLLIGPSAGWSLQEEQNAQQAGFIPLTLGAHTLRAETAGMALLAALLAHGVIQ